MEKETSVLEFDYSQSRTITRNLDFNSEENKEVIKTHFFFVLLKDLPSNIPTGPNPRKADINAKPCKQMIETLEVEPEHFTDCNRGLLLIANKVYFPRTNDEDKRLILDFGVDDDGVVEGGLVDGGHTYEVLKRRMGDETIAEMPVFITVIEGADKFSSQLARARNTSVQVTEKSMANLENEFDSIKDALGDYSKKVIYFENESKGEDSAVFQVEELIALMTALNKGLYDKTQQPTVTYTGISSCFNKWLNKKNRATYEKLYPLLRSTVETYEYLYLHFEAYAKDAGFVRVGGINGIEVYRGKGNNKKPVQFKLPFCEETVRYRLSKGFSMPIFAALRFLLEEDSSGNLKWAIDPKVFLDKHGSKLVRQIIDAHSKEYGSNPNKTGKSKVLWQNIANSVIIHSLEEQLARK